MALEVRYKNGKLIDHWFGRCFIDGKAKVFTLTTLLDGIPPTKPDGRITLLGQGDSDFEISRTQAAAELKDREMEARQKGRADHLTERVIQSKTGRKPEYKRLADLPELWRGLDRDGNPPGEPYLKWCDSVFKRFAAKVHCEFLYEVTSQQAKAFLDEIRESRTSKTADGMRTLLRSAFNAFLPVGVENPLGKAVRGHKGAGKRKSGDEGGMIGREPLTETELEKLLETARSADPLLYRLAVVCAFTSLRIGDVAMLKWSAVDLSGEGWVKVLTSKTGTEIEVPFLDIRLREVFESALAEREEDAPYVFPSIAKMYQGKTSEGNSKRNMVYYRGKALFAKAFAPSEKEPLDVNPEGLVEKRKSDLAEELPHVMGAVKRARFTEAKCARILDSLRRVAQGQSYRAIEAETGRSRAIVSQDLNDAERVSDLTFRTGGTKSKHGRDIKTLISHTRKNRKIGCHAASTKGWHNLRGTFCCLAFAAGYDFEFVSKATGHTLARTMRDHYFNPRRDHWRAAMRRHGGLLPEAVQIETRELPALPAVEENKLQSLADTWNGLSKSDKKQLQKMINTGRA